jgi:RNA polymerase sigma-70 factor (ECF subfamily)
MTDASAGSARDAFARDTFNRLLGELRPKLHRYCARMTGSVIDGEDVLQEALVKAIEAFAAAGPLNNPEGWLFRIAHNTALDHLRARARADRLVGEGDPDMAADTVDPIADREIVGASLRSFMHLPAQQRSSVILMDVLGYSLDEIGSITAMTVPGIKAALHRGRARLRQLAAAADDKAMPQLGARERALLAAYVDRFNARDVDGFRDLLAEDVKLEVITRFKRQGRADVGTYIGRYAVQDDWHLVPGLVEGRPAALVIDPRETSGQPTYFVLLDVTSTAVTAITDFRYARYVMEGAEVVMLQS